MTPHRYRIQDKVRRQRRRDARRLASKKLAQVVYARTKAQLEARVGPLRAKFMLRRGVHSPLVQEVLRKVEAP